MCTLLGIQNIQIQCDSTLAVQWYYNESKIPWILRKWWNFIWSKIDGLNYSAKHVLREQNQASDWLAS